MFCIGIRYLCGWAMATHPTDRDRPEWPPHPDRVFMALAAAHFETDGGPEEYEALKQLSSWPSPALSFAPAHDRQTVTTFVPVNDDARPLNKSGAPMMPSGSLPIGRDRQPRSFQVAVPERNRILDLARGRNFRHEPTCTRSSLPQSCRGWPFRVPRTDVCREQSAGC